MLGADLSPFYDTGAAGFARVVTLGATTLPGILDTVTRTVL